MQTTLRIDDEVHRRAKAEAARRGMTLTRFIEEAIQAKIAQPPLSDRRQAEIEERHQMMEALLLRTAHFQVGPRPTRDEMHERPGVS